MAVVEKRGLPLAEEEHCQGSRQSDEQERPTALLPLQRGLGREEGEKEGEGEEKKPA